MAKNWHERNEQNLLVDFNLYAYMSWFPKVDKDAINCTNIKGTRNSIAFRCADHLLGSWVGRKHHEVTRDCHALENRTGWFARHHITVDQKLMYKCYPGGLDCINTQDSCNVCRGNYAKTV